LRIPDYDDEEEEEEDEQIREEEMTVRKGCEEKENVRMRCLREGVSISHPLEKPHAYSHEGETVRM